MFKSLLERASTLAPEVYREVWWEYMREFSPQPISVTSLDDLRTWAALTPENFSFCHNFEWDSDDDDDIALMKEALSDEVGRRLSGVSFEDTEWIPDTLFESMQREPYVFAGLSDLSVTDTYLGDGRLETLLANPGWNRSLRLLCLDMVGASERTLSALEREDASRGPGRGRGVHGEPGRREFIRLNTNVRSNQ